MSSDRITDYIDRVYGYAVKRTFSEEEAADLSQEILCTAIRELPKLREESRFEPWLWGIAENVSKTFRRKMGKQRAMFSYDIPENLVYEEDDSEENEELYASMRQKIAMLSAIYRNILILYYYDGLSVNEISERLSVPEGTVTWRLSRAREKLKKECKDMEETALRPKEIQIDIYGSGEYNGSTMPFPSVYVNDALSQNILCRCYTEALSVEALAKLSGVPAYYIEERIGNLLRRNAILKTAKGKFRTNFIIWSDKDGLYAEENEERCMHPIMDRVLDALDGIAEEANCLGIHTGGKEKKDLYYLYGLMAFGYASEHYCDLAFPEIPQNYDGYRWRYIATMQDRHHASRAVIAQQISGNMGSRGTYMHKVYGRIGGFGFRPMMFDSQINVCEDILCTGTTEDIATAAGMIERGYLLHREDGSLFVPIPAFTKEQKVAFDAIADRHLAPLMGEYRELIKQYVDGLKRLFPSHLSDDVDRVCHGLFVGMYNVIVSYAQRVERIEMPKAGGVCDVLIQHK